MIKFIVSENLKGDNLELIKTIKSAVTGWHDPRSCPFRVGTLEKRGNNKILLRLGIITPESADKANAKIRFMESSYEEMDEVGDLISEVEERLRSLVKEEAKVDNVSAVDTRGGFFKVQVTFKTEGSKKPIRSQLKFLANDLWERGVKEIGDEGKFFELESDEEEKDLQPVESPGELVLEFRMKYSRKFLVDLDKYLKRFRLKTEVVGMGINILKED